MKDFDLEATLKSVPLPERSADYWENFPAQVRWQMRRAAPKHEVRESWRAGFAWGIGVSLACLVLGTLVLNQPLREASGAIIQQEKYVRQHLASIPSQLRVLMANEHGLHYLITEKE